jgi:urease accessory protein
VFARVQPESEFAKAGGEAEIAGDQWLIWQLADSAFPTGGFAHSGGLEATWQHGELRNRAELRSFIEASLWQFGKGSLPFMLGAYDQPAELLRLDLLCDSFTTNHVANRASRLQGRALLASAERIFGGADLKQIRESASAGQPFHLSPVFGGVVRALGIGRRTVAELFFFTYMRGLTASAVRLGVIGPMEAQSLQHQCASPAVEILDHCEMLTVDDVAQTAPLLDLWQGAQDRLYSRLFQS